MSRQHLLWLVGIVLIGSFLVTACGGLTPAPKAASPAAVASPAQPTVHPAPTPTSASAPAAEQLRTVLPLAPTATVGGARAVVDPRVEQILAQLTLAEKIGQMTQAESGSITPEEVTAYAIGSVLTGGGGAAQPNTPEGWLQRSMAYQDAALQTRLGIPLLYGVDAGTSAWARPTTPT